MNSSVWYSGLVIKGKGRGTRLGFATINLSFEKNIDIKHGIYLCLVKINNQEYRGLLHWGPIPTFKEQKPAAEILIQEQIPNLSIGTKVFFQPERYLRRIIKFAKLEDLSAQIKKDLENLK